MAAFEHVQRWMEQTRGLTVESTVEMEVRKEWEHRVAASIIALQQLYSFLLMNGCAEALQGLGIADEDGNKARQLQVAVDQAKEVSRKHGEFNASSDYCWRLYQLHSVLSRPAFSWLESAATAEDEGGDRSSQWVGRPEVKVAMAIDKRIAALGCRNALEQALRPRLTREERRRILALVEDKGSTNSDLSVQYGRCLDLFRASPLCNETLSTATQFVLESERAHDEEGAAEYMREFLKEFCRFAVVEEEA